MSVPDDVLVRLKDGLKAIATYPDTSREYFILPLLREAAARIEKFEEERDSQQRAYVNLNAAYEEQKARAERAEAEREVARGSSQDYAALLIEITEMLGGENFGEAVHLVQNLRAERDALREALGRLVDYDEHSSACERRLTGGPCNCGRSEALLNARALLFSPAREGTTEPQTFEMVMAATRVLCSNCGQPWATRQWIPATEHTEEQRP